MLQKTRLLADGPVHSKVHLSHFPARYLACCNQFARVVSGKFFWSSILFYFCEQPHKSKLKFDLMIDSNVTAEQLNANSNNTMVEHLGILITEVGSDYIKGTMPVDQRTLQPHGLLHGGASVVLAETLASIAANCVVDSQKYYCVGLEINANHIKSARDGLVHGVTKPLHIGRQTQVWEIKITNDKGQLVCVSRITMAVLNRQ